MNLKHRCLAIISVAALAFLLLAPARASGQQSCASLASLRIPNVTITLAKSISTPPGFQVTSVPGRLGTPAGMKVSVPFCRVAGFASPTSDSHISFEVWLPVRANRNGLYIGVGNPAFVGAIVYGSMAREVAFRPAIVLPTSRPLIAEYFMPLISCAVFLPKTARAPGNPRQPLLRLSTVRRLPRAGGPCGSGTRLPATFAAH